MLTDRLRMGRDRAIRPSSLDALHAWWDGDDAATLTESGGSISRVADKSGNGYDLVQAVQASQPQAVAWGDRMAISFAPAAALLQADTVASVWDLLHARAWAESTVFLVTDGGNLEDSWQFVWSTTPVTSTPGGDCVYRSFGRVDRRMFASWGMSLNDPTDAFDTAAPALLVSQLQGGTHAWRVNGVDEVAVAVTQPDGEASHPLVLGARSPDGALPFSGRVAEMVVVAEALDPETVEGVERYLTRKWMS